MKVALVYDRVNKFGGAERVLCQLHDIFPDAPLYTLVHDPNKAQWSSKFNVIPTYLNKIPFLRSRHEILAPFASMAFETFNFSDFDIVISITSSDSKAIITPPGTFHLCLCLTPTRYFWSGESEYINDWKMKLIPNFIKEYLKQVDLLNSQRPDRYIAISNEVKKRINTYYNRESTIVYPSIEDKFYSIKSPVPNKERGYYLVVSRLVKYKKVDQVILSFNYTGLPLTIVGTGSDMNFLKSIANSNIKFVGEASDNELIKLYRHAKATIFPQLEDFGLVPIESQACGTPVIAYGSGGALETVVGGKTGTFYPEQTPESMTQAVLKFAKLKIDPQDCIKNALRFSPVTFRKNIMSVLTELA